jgi:signal transduction histidine kinase
MLKLTLFRKQLAILLIVTVVFAGFAMLMSDFAVRAMMSWSSKDDASGGPTQGLVRLVNGLTETGKLSLEEVVEQINRSAPNRHILGIRVVSEEDLKREFHVEPELVPADPYQAHTVREDGLRFPRLIVFRAKVDPNRYLVFDRGDRSAEPGPGGMHGGPGGFPPPPPPGGPGGPDGLRPPPIFFWLFVAHVFSGFLAAAISLFLLFSSMRRKARQAADVISAIKKGDWQKRMPIDGVDEVGQLMTEFNRMADEIESAVRSLQRAEASRTGLLQELAHDLRTPVASLRGLIETLEMRSEALDAKSRGELFSLAQKEIDYFARLIEDLLFLAQVRDPRYLNSAKQVDIAQVLRDQVARTSAEGKVSVAIAGLNDGPLLLSGDEVLLKRLVRNAVDNAMSFARSRIAIEVHQTATDRPRLEIKIRDDGPGFSEQALATFGEKRFSRFIGADEGERLSVGLGSVIMSTVVGVHGGSITAINAASGGAEVSIKLPMG